MSEGPTKENLILSMTGLKTTHCNMVMLCFQTTNIIHAIFFAIRTLNPTSCAKNIPTVSLGFFDQNE
jgi:hypothetical protein